MSANDAMNDAMNDATTTTNTTACADGARAACDCADVAAYLDGELSVAEGAQFESHLASCRACSQALADQRRLLCLLDAAFARARGSVELPEDFVRVVKARAQTDMTSVRSCAERRRALVFSLGAFAFALIVALLAGVAPVAAAARAAASLLDMLLHTLAEASAGAVVVLRSLGRYLASGTDAPTRAAVFAALACALALLLRLVAGYHRQDLRD